jgi:hypothetical protein
MRGREEVAVRFSDVIVKRLVTRSSWRSRTRRGPKCSEAGRREPPDGPDRHRGAPAPAGYARDIREKGLDYRQLFSKTKEKLARDRGFVL